MIAALIYMASIIALMLIIAAGLGFFDDDDPFG
jgi:hypothetical protein